MVPKKVFFTKGVGSHREKLQSFELALRSAKIERLNIVRVSSIFPPKCKMVSRSDGLKLLSPGEITCCVLSQLSTDEPQRQVCASIGLAIPGDNSHYGYISEHHEFGITSKESSDYAEDLAATMLATTLGIDFDSEKDYDERREIYRMSGKIIKTYSITQAAKGRKERGRKKSWTTVLAAAVFIG